MRKALIVGVDYYKHNSSLRGCVNDANAMHKVLERNDDSDRTINFGTKLLTATGEGHEVLRRHLRDQIEELFKDESEIALFYFSGHGDIDSIGGYLMTSECNEGDEGMSMNELLNIVNKSPANHKVVILDCCHSGIMGTPGITENKAILSKDVTILTASSAEQYATEKNGSGVFTTLLVDALNGAAANLTGAISPGSAYAHIDQSLGPWQQRPNFMTNIKNFITLRKVKPPIPPEDLRKITKFFKEKDSEFPLDPSYEATSESAIPENTAKLAILQKYNRINLVTPIGTIYMYSAAMESKSCKLTVLGQYYWKLVKNRLL